MAKVRTDRKARASTSSYVDASTHVIVYIPICTCLKKLGDKIALGVIYQVLLTFWGAVFVHYICVW